MLDLLESIIPSILNVPCHTHIVIVVQLGVLTLIFEAPLLSVVARLPSPWPRSSIGCRRGVVGSSAWRGVLRRGVGVCMGFAQETGFFAASSMGFASQSYGWLVEFISRWLRMFVDGSTMSTHREHTTSVFFITSDR